MGMQYVQFRRRTCFLLMRNDLITFCRYVQYCCLWYCSLVENVTIILKG